MQLEIRLECGCSPGKVFKTKATYNAHLKTQKHNKWVINNDIKNYKKSTTEYDNTLTSYKFLYCTNQHPAILKPARTSTGNL